MDRSKTWLVNLICALSAFKSTSAVSIAKFGVCSEKLSASDHAQHQIEQTHLQECEMFPQRTMYIYFDEQTIANVVDVSNGVIITTGVSTSVYGERLNILPPMNRKRG